MMKRMSTLSSENRNDLHLTSTGVGHAARESRPFPPPSFKPTRTTLPLPSHLSPSPNGPTVEDVYQSTTASAHCYRPPDPLLQHPQHQKPASHRRVQYTLDAVNKLEAKPWRRPLTMAHQTTEMRGQYRCEPELIDRVIPHSGDPQPPTLSDHFRDGPTKELAPSTTIRKMQGRDCRANNLAVLDWNQPYITTNNRHHRSFRRRELSRYTRGDAATFWQCEDYPKAWGFGTRENPLTTRLSRTDPGPMRDRTVFRTGTTIPRVPPSLQPISTGQHSVYADTYTGIDRERRDQLFHCPVQPAVKAQGYDTSLVQTVPHMYRTMNMTYGSPPAPPTETVG